jgi:hypothetical protein
MFTSYAAMPGLRSTAGTTHLDRPTRRTTAHNHENADSQQRPTANQLRPDPGTDVDERRRTGKDSAHE